MKGVWRWWGGGREIIYLSLHCHHQNDSCIKVGSDERHFNVSLIVRDKVIRQCAQTTTFEEKGEPKRIRPEVPLLISLTPYRLTVRPNRLTYNFPLCPVGSNTKYGHKKVLELKDYRPTNIMYGSTSP